VVHGVALNIQAQTCDGALDMGLTACADALPEVCAVASDPLAPFDELLPLVPRAIAPISHR
jgi:diacylglycerol O-acyltransferase / wax synthase